MSNPTQDKTWKDVVGSAPTGTITVVQGSTETQGNVVGIKIDEKNDIMLVEYADPKTPTRTTWLKVERTTNTLEISLSVKFSEESAGTEERRFIAKHGGVVVTIYVTKRLTAK